MCNCTYFLALTAQKTRQRAAKVGSEYQSIIYFIHGASLVAQMVKRLPAMRETRVRFLGREDPLEKEMAIHSNILAWKIPWTEEPGGLQSMGWQESDTT